MTGVHMREIMKRGKLGLAQSLIRNLTVITTGVALALPALASGGAKGAAEGINYIPITPPLVVNYGGPGKARYIKAELSIRSENAADADTVTHHLPLIRDRLVSILSAQNDEIVSSAEGKEYLRSYALAEINKALLQVQGLPAEPASAEPIAATSAPTVPGAATPTSASPTSAAPGAAAAAPNGTALPAATAGIATNSAGIAASLPPVVPVKGPASDLYFNNFVVQK